MGIADFFSDLMSSMSFQEVHAEAPKEDETAEAGDEGEEPKDDEAKEEGEDEPAEAQEEEAEEEEEDDEPVDLKPKLEEGMCLLLLILNLLCGRGCSNWSFAS
jgi:ubiquinol-cytochrome c reductase subunit 6